MPANADVTRIEPDIADASSHPIRQAAPLPAGVPLAAKWLGALGAIPFVFLAMAGPLLEGTLQEQVFFALSAYGAVILSFLGGVHWGLAIAGFGPASSAGPSFRRLSLSVVPSLIGWGALFLPNQVGLLVLAAAFTFMFLVDWQASRKSEAPVWYSRLRGPLTMVVAASLTLGAFA